VAAASRVNECHVSWPRASAFLHERSIVWCRTVCCGRFEGGHTLADARGILAFRHHIRSRSMQYLHAIYVAAMLIGSLVLGMIVAGAMA
jgi:hypothetical protein